MRDGFAHERTKVDFWDLTKLLFRRWYVAVPLLLLSLAGAASVAVTVRPDYVATSYVQLVPPTAPEAKPGEQPPTPRNPWLSMGLGSLSGAATITVSDSTVLKQLKAKGYSENFTLKMEGQLPIVKIEVIGDSPEQAGDTAQELVRLLDENVNALQAKYNVARQDLIVTQRLDLGDNLSESSSKVKRALVAVAGAGVLLSAGVTIATDAWLRKRARRRNDPAGGADPDGDDPKAADSGPAPEEIGYARVAKAGGAVGQSQVLVPTIPGGAAQEEPPTRRQAAARVPGRGGDGRVDYRGGEPVAPGQRVPGVNAPVAPARREDAADDTSVLSMIPSDATVILPLSHNEDWNTPPNGRARR
ncbi:hypothetical protein [Rhizomonospora bruguierae]|uniref:hypothetical protein n=1 Tax=Rhizomonospora bruguierae TaxID=1581705 RepID=UPI001BD14537|nr:hypothetical protein [Micromonospora sp. NBRC 107566]